VRAAWETARTFASVSRGGRDGRIPDHLIECAGGADRLRLFSCSFLTICILGGVGRRGDFASSRTAPEIAACYVVCMSKLQDRMIAGFTPGERDYIRRELDMFFSTLPSVAEGFQLKTWRGGPDAGKPKLPSTAKGLIARGLMRLDNEGHFPRLFFTEAGLTALRAMMTDRRLVDPKKFAHVRQELGIDPSSEDEARD
jgi:hypothetical protein